MKLIELRLDFELGVLVYGCNFSIKEEYYTLEVSLVYLVSFRLVRIYSKIVF